MNAERWQQLQDLFDAGLALEDVERDALLQKQCKDDPILAGEVRALWQQRKEAGDFLQGSPVAAKERRWSPVQVIANRFRITAFVAAGGMAEVYRAIDELLGRTVAIKV